jgi:hypothetical protein
VHLMECRGQRWDIVAEFPLGDCSSDPTDETRRAMERERK